MDESKDLNFSIDCMRQLYSPVSEFRFNELNLKGEIGYIFPPIITVGLAYDPLINHDGSHIGGYKMSPVVNLISKSFNGILYYVGFKVQWMGDNLPQEISNTYTTAMMMIRR